ncbi:hypothetical protein P9112_007986 [Eukaryota sp. TZLM1-RC]
MDFVNLDCDCCCAGQFEANLFKKSQCTQCYHSYDVHKHLNEGCQCCTNNPFRPNPFMKTVCADCQHVEVAHASKEKYIPQTKSSPTVGKLGRRIAIFNKEDTAVVSTAVFSPPSRVDKPEAIAVSHTEDPQTFASEPSFAQIVDPNEPEDESTSHIEEPNDNIPPEDHLPIERLTESDPTPDISTEEFNNDNIIEVELDRCEDVSEQLDVAEFDVDPPELPDEDSLELQDNMDALCVEGE